MHIVNVQYGNFSPDDIDWERLEMANGNFIIYKLFDFYNHLGLIDFRGEDLVTMLHLGRYFGRMGNGFTHLRGLVEVSLLNDLIL